MQLDEMNVASPTAPDQARLAALHAIEEKVLWLAVWMIHHANHIRPKLDGLKVATPDRQA